MGLDVSAYKKLTKLDVLFDEDGEPVNPVTRELIDDYVKKCARVTPFRNCWISVMFMAVDAIPSGAPVQPIYFSPRYLNRLQVARPSATLIHRTASPLRTTSFNNSTLVTGRPGHSVSWWAAAVQRK